MPHAPVLLDAIFGRSRPPARNWPLLPAAPGSSQDRSVSSSSQPFKVLIAGGGVAALEAALALRDLGGERIATTILAPGPEFVYRPMSLGEPIWFHLASALVPARGDRARHRRGAAQR